MIDKAFFKQGMRRPCSRHSSISDISSFMVWVMLGPLGVQIASDLQLDAARRA